MVGFIIFIVGFGVFIAVVYCIDTLSDWYHAYQDKQHTDLQKELLQTAWRELDVKRTQFNAEQALHEQAMGALNQLLSQQDVEQQQLRQCKLNHPSNYGG